MEEIRAAKNGKCKYIRSLEQKKNRLRYGEYIIEGIKNVAEAVSFNAPVTAIYVSDGFYNTKAFDYPSDIPLYKLPDSIFDSISPAKTPQGILASVRIDFDMKIELNPEKCYVYCDGISDPGNLGTIIRTADAAGFGGVLMSQGCVDLYSPKVIRSTMGSVFHIEVQTEVLSEELKKYKDKGFQLLGGALEADAADYRGIDYTLPTIIMVGNEANGLSKEAREVCTPVKIPIVGQAESLNAGVAAAILMYEAVRARS